MRRPLIGVSRHAHIGAGSGKSIDGSESSSCYGDAGRAIGGQRSTGATRVLKISVPTGVYDVVSLQAAINREVSLHPAGRRWLPGAAVAPRLR